MALYTFYGYAPDALTYNAGSNSWTLDAAYDHTEDRVRFDITDDDNAFSGDSIFNELGDDSNQTAVVSEPDGTVISTGRIYDDKYHGIDKPGGGTIWIEEVEIGGTLLGYIVSEELTPGFGYVQNVTGETTSSLELDYSQLASIACYGAGTLIECLDGPVPIEQIKPGMRVLTLDNGYVTVLWASKRPVSIIAQMIDPGLRPVEITRGALGGGMPERDLTVSQQHRVFFGAGAGYFAPAKGLVNRDGITLSAGGRPVTYHHILCAHHQVISANGCWSETLFPGKMVFRILGAKARGEVERLLGPGLADYKLARPCLSVREALRSKGRPVQNQIMGWVA